PARRPGAQQSAPRHRARDGPALGGRHGFLARDPLELPALAGVDDPLGRRGVALRGKQRDPRGEYGGVRMDDAEIDQPQGRQAGLLQQFAARLGGAVGPFAVAARDLPPGINDGVAGLPPASGAGRRDRECGHARMAAPFDDPVVAADASIRKPDVIEVELQPGILGLGIDQPLFDRADLGFHVGPSGGEAWCRDAGIMEYGAARSSRSRSPAVFALPADAVAVTTHPRLPGTLIARQRDNARLAAFDTLAGLTWGSRT